MAGITPLFTPGQINDWIDIFRDAAEKKIEEALQYAGESALSEAKLSGSYTDQTGNLRSSIGYMILKNGIVIDGLFEEASSGTDRKTGLSKGKALADELRTQFSEGYVLVVVAGMEYAVYVEAMGLDVLTFTEAKTKGLLSNLIKGVVNGR